MFFAQIALKLGIVCPKLKSRISSLRNRNKHKLTQKPLNQGLKLNCLYPYLTWTKVYHLFSISAFDESEFASIPTSKIEEIIKLFKDETMMIISLECIYKFIFGIKEIHHRQKNSEKQHLKNVMIGFFPIIFLTCGSNEWAIDITKIDLNKNSFLKLIEDLIEDYDENSINDQIKKRGN